MTRTKRKKKTDTKWRTPVRTSKEEIQEKAMDLFLRKGYHGTSTTELCEAIGISRPTLYWYFQDKEDILFSIHKDTIEKHIQPITARMQETKDPLVRLHVFIRMYARTMCLCPHPKVLINETPYLAPEHEAWVRGKWSDVFRSVREAIRELKDEGKIKELPDLFTAFSLIGMVSWPYTWFDHSRPESLESLVETMEEIFFYGVLKPGISRHAHCREVDDVAHHRSEQSQGG
ncbi:MAG: TetR/AcrR family transcriptional regulator [Pseudomonadota bacterium]